MLVVNCMNRGVSALVSVVAMVIFYISFINTDTMEYFVGITCIHFCTIFEIYCVHVTVLYTLK